MPERLKSKLIDAGIDADFISRVLDSGYIIRDWCDPFSRKTWTSVSDLLYGNKQFSSSFETEKFIAYVKGDSTFESLPPFRRYTAKSIDEIRAILSEPDRARLIRDGRLSFRGQTQEHRLKRQIPNPVRSDRNGYEISILPGLYRQSGPFYSVSDSPEETRSFRWLLDKLEPNNPNVFMDATYAADIMRVEQHYATQTAGLDISFDIETAMFFATHQFEQVENGLSTYRHIPPGQHRGVIYCFCFYDPPVKASEFLIKRFDLFNTHPPERILRQRCGLPLIGPHERNIAITDLDCIIELHSDFWNDVPKIPEWMFPGISEDAFYKKLLEIKDANPALLSNIVEYEWARTT